MTTIVNSFPTTIKNGDNEDATVLMSLFTFIQSQVNGNACPKTSGNVILKGDSAGGTVPAVAGTDYFAPAANGSLTVGGGAQTAANPVAFSATPTFDASKSNIHYFGALTANVTSSTISNPTDAQTISIRFVQDGAGSRTVALPANVTAAGAINTTPGKVSWLTITYVASASRWEGVWANLS